MGCQKQKIKLEHDNEKMDTIAAGIKWEGGMKKLGWDVIELFEYNI